MTPDNLITTQASVQNTSITDRIADMERVRAESPINVIEEPNDYLTRRNLEQEFTRKSNFNGIPLLTSFFEGDVDQCRHFFNQFDDLAKLSNWNSNERLTILKSRLRGNALSYLLSDNELSESKDYNFVKSKLVEFFSQESGLAEKQLNFANCKQWANEPVKNFAHRLLLASNNYLGDSVVVTKETKNILDKLRLSKFVSALLPELQSDVLKANPNSFEEAVRVAQNSQMAQETMTKLRVNNLNSNGFVNGPHRKIVDNDMASRMEALTLEVNNLRQTQMPPKDEFPINCILCGSRSHLTVSCQVFHELKQLGNNANRNFEFPRGRGRSNRGNQFGRVFRGRYNAYRRGNSAQNNEQVRDDHQQNLPTGTDEQPNPDNFLGQVGESDQI